jgi:RNA polymerase sigma-70 factor, ECF subfamily
MDVSQQDAAASFEAHRRHLTGLAYRMLGSLAEAQDAVQEAYLRWHQTNRAEVNDPRAFLSRVVAHLCLDQLKSARVRRERYVGPWLPEPILDDRALASDSANEYAQDLSVALMLTLERLTPPERAAFLLHDVFDMSFEEVAGVLERSPAGCRQLAARARSHVRAARPRYRPSETECERLAAAFGAAAQSGDPQALAGLLAEDVTYYSDAGGKVPSATRPVAGRDKVARLVMGLATKGASNIKEVRPARISGAPGFIIEFRSGEISTMGFDFRGGLIAGIYLMRNPDKLRHVQM